MPFTVHDLRYNYESTFPTFHAYLQQRAKRYLGSFAYDAFEVEEVVGHVIEQLAQLGLLGGGDHAPETALDRLSNAQFYAFLNQSVKNKAIDRLRRHRLPTSTLGELEESGNSEEGYMGIDIQRIIDKKEPPLTRTDVEHLIEQAGGSDKLGFSGRNLQGIDLSRFPLKGANLSGANLSSADLRDAKLGSAILESKVIEQTSAPEDKSLIHIRIIEEPLTLQNVALILTALTELTTKLWLIAKRRFADLIEYTQTHDIRFANEAGSSIVSASKHSPFNFGFQVDRLVPSVAEAVMTVVDGLSQRKVHLETLEIANVAAAQKIKEAEENLKQQQDMAAFEREKQEIALEKLRLENEKERQALVEQRLESQRKQIEDALELAGKAVDIVYPNADAEMRPMLIQTVLSNILQLQSAAGLVLILPKNKDDDSSKEDMEQT